MTATAERYNGWSNRTTWTAHLWLSNDQRAYLMCRRLAGDAALFREYVEARHILESVMDPDGYVRASLASDLLLAAAMSIDWAELQQAFTDEELT